MTKEEEISFAINRMAEEVHKNAYEKGFHFEEDDLKFMATATANIHGEVSELWEAYRAGEEFDACDKYDAGCRLSCREEELADIIIRALDVSKRLGVDIGEAIRIKRAFNKTRPHMHGKKN